MIVCKKCGRSVKDGAVFCPGCGTRIDSEQDSGTGNPLRKIWDEYGGKSQNDQLYQESSSYQTGSDQQNSQGAANSWGSTYNQGTTGYMSSRAQVFVEDDEVKITSLDSKIVSYYMSSGTVGRETCVLTNKRVYYSGKNLSTLHHVKQSRVIDLETVTSVGFTQVGFSFVYKFVSLLFFVLNTIGAVVAAILTHHPRDYAPCIVFALIALTVYIVFLFLKRNAVEITFMGDQIVFLAAGDYGYLSNFQYEVMRAKKKLMSELKKEPEQSESDK